MNQASPQTIKTEKSAALFDMKAGHFTVPTLCIKSSDTDALDLFLAQQIAKLPQFFDQAPLVIDLTQFDSDEVLDEFPMIVGMVRGHGMIPVGVRGVSEEQKEQAKMLELAIMPKSRIPAALTADTSNNSSISTTPSANKPLVIDKAIRSGQRIYAEGTDLILLAGVSSGAEVMADGHIHAYGAVRGRMLAGVKDNIEARIFCKDMGAELVAIAGRYRVSEDIPNKYIGRSVQISLAGDALEFASL